MVAMRVARSLDLCAAGGLVVRAGRFHVVADDGNTRAVLDTLGDTRLIALLSRFRVSPRSGSLRATVQAGTSAAAGVVSIPRSNARSVRAWMRMMATEGSFLACTRRAGHLMKTPLRTLTVCLLLATGAAQAGLFSRKAKPAPPTPPAPAPVVVPIPPPPPPAPIPLEFSGIQSAAPLPAPMDRLQSAPREVLDTVEWVGATRDNAGLPFVVVDKVNARVYAFTPAAQLKATAPVLLGGGIGDKVLVAPDVPMSAIPVHKRITPAGRYPSRLVIDNHGKTVLLVDGPNLITMHVVARGTPAQRRAERLASVAADDNRVSFGCINVPPAFFAKVLDPDFRTAAGIVYVLPEKTTPAQLFGFQPHVATPTPALPQPLLTAAETPGQPMAAPGIESSPMAASVTQALPAAPGAAPMPAESGQVPVAPVAPDVVAN
jgi:hypothetical protein